MPGIFDTWPAKALTSEVRFPAKCTRSSGNSNTQARIELRYGERCIPVLEETVNKYRAGGIRA